MARRSSAAGAEEGASAAAVPERTADRRARNLVFALWSMISSSARTWPAKAAWPAVLAEAGRRAPRLACCRHSLVHRVHGEARSRPRAQETPEVERAGSNCDAARTPNFYAFKPRLVGLVSNTSRNRSKVSRGRAAHGSLERWHDL